MTFLSALTKHAEELQKKWAVPILLALLVTVLFPVWETWVEYASLEAWRHDSLYYLQSYQVKMQTEGRWLNFFLFNALRQIDPLASALLHALALGWFSGFCAAKLTGDRLYSVLLALLAATSVPLYIQLLWPVSTLPSFLILASTPLLYRRMSPILFFGLYGVLLFATFSNLYFLLPLLYMAQLVSAAGNAREQRRILVFDTVLPWIGGYVFGFLIATLVVGVISGQWGIQIADWRGGLPATDLKSLITNILIAWSYLRDHLAFHIQYTGWPINLAVVCLFLQSLRSRKPDARLILPALVALSLYASIVPYSVNLSYRTSSALGLGLIFLFLAPSKISGLERLVYGIVVLLLISINAGAAKRDLRWFRQSTDFYRSELQEVTAGKLATYKGILLLSGRPELQAVEHSINREFGLNPGPGIKTLGVPARWRAVVSDLGAKSIRVCGNEKHMAACENLSLPADGQWLRSNSGLYDMLEYESGWLLLRIRPDLTKP
jgi:hypothetical protein